MKVKIEKYRSQWTSQVHHDYMNKKNTKVVEYND